MKIQFKHTARFAIVIMTVAVIFHSCKNEEWAQHYSLDKTIVSDSTLWQVINANPRLTKFSALLHKAGYDSILNRSQMYTVWAPENASLDTAVLNKLDIATLKKEFVENHIARGAFSASGISGIDSMRPAMIDKKFIFFKPIGSRFVFGDANVAVQNKACKNGLIHEIDNAQPYLSNIWEYMAKTPGLDSVNAYLSSFDTLSLDLKRSIPGDLNSLGQVVYLDSVMINNNKMFKKIGALNNEDSSYIAILPTNVAWNTAIAKIQPYFRYYRGKSTAQNYPITKYTADTLQQNNTRFSVVRDLIFTKRHQSFGMDSVYSTFYNTVLNTNIDRKDKFYNPSSTLVQGLNSIKASNGDMFVTDLLTHNSWDSWSKKITVEAEQSTNRYYSTVSTNLTEKGYSGKDFKDQVSNNRYILLKATGTSAKPTVTFDIPNTMAGKLNSDSTIAYGQAYNIYCVFLPDTIESYVAPKPSKVKFELTYMNDGVKKNLDGKTAASDGSIQTELYGSDTKSYLISKSKVTKILVAKKVTFPYCEYGKLNSATVLTNVNVRLKITSTVTPTDVNDKTNPYTKNLYIDCVILEPVH